MRSFKEELDQLESLGLKRSIPRSGKAPFVNLSSNDYLGLATHPKVIEAAQAAAQTHGVGGTSSRLLAGTSESHTQLEADLAQFLSKDKALVFSSGFHVNVGLLPALTGPRDMIFVDRLCHASILDGVRLSSARFCTFEHNNVDHLDSLLRKRRVEYDRAFIVTEGVFSMDGDFGMLREIVYLAKTWSAHVYLDEAHSLGLFGPGGRGWAASLGLLKDVDIFVGTLSKSLGSQGGFVACHQTVADLLISKARSFIYTTALSPICAEAARASLQLLPGFDVERQQIQAAAQSFRARLQGLGFSTLTSESQIIPVLTHDVSSTKKLSDYLLSHGYFVPSIRPPTVPKGQGRVRLSLTKKTLNKELEKLGQVFSSYGEKIVQTV